MKLKDAIEEVRTKPTVPLSVVGTVLDMSRGSVYQAAHSGEIDVIRIGHRIRAVTAPLRKKLGIEVLRLPTEEVKTVDTVTNPKTVKPKRWRDVLPIHPAADEFPELSETELRELADDIEAHGLRELVALYDDPEIGLCLLDGRNRADALELIGKSITDDNEENWTEHVGEDDPDFDPYAFVVSKNIKRRHLTSEKKRDVIAKLLTLNPAKSTLDRDPQAAGGCGKGAREKGAEKKEPEIIWPEPKPLPNGLPKVDAFEYEFLPDRFAPWALDVSNRLQCPPDYVAVAVMTALGSVIGRRVGIKPQAKTDWTEIPNLWACSSADRER